MLLGLGSLAAGGATVVGSGAVSSVTADRDVLLTIEGDDDAYLGLKAGSNAGDFVRQKSDGTLEIAFDDSVSGATGTGINNRADTTLSNAFEIHNQTDRTLYVYAGFAHPGTGDAVDPTSGAARSVELNADGTDITYPGSEDKSSEPVTSRALGQNTDTGAIALTSGSSASVEIRFLVYGSNDPRDSDFLTVFEAVEDDPRPTQISDHEIDVNV